MIHWATIPKLELVLFSTTNLLSADISAHRDCNRSLVYMYSVQWEGKSLIERY